jgi:hypothetical protein
MDVTVQLDPRSSSKMRQPHTHEDLGLTKEELDRNLQSRHEQVDSDALWTMTKRPKAPLNAAQMRHALQTTHRALAQTVKWQHCNALLKTRGKNIWAQNIVSRKHHSALL